VPKLDLVKLSMSVPMRYRPVTPAHNAQIKIKMIRLISDALLATALPSRSSRVGRKTISR